jgi:hypothetical protein
MRAASSDADDSYSRMRSIGSKPLRYMAGVERANDGITRPGQSHSISVELSISVWKCFVLPGVDVTPVFFSAISTLIVDDLPTFG